MSQKTIIVTGASGNLGKAVVQEFLKRDDKVVGVVHHKRRMEHTSVDYSEYEVDLTDEGLTQYFVNSITEKHHDVYAAVLTAGGFGMGKLQDTTVKDLQKQYRLNFLTAYNLVRPLIDKMHAQGGGKLFFIGSEPGMDTKKGKAVVAYSLSKTLLFQLANIINADEKQSNVQSHVVVPSTIVTPQNRKAAPHANFDKWQKPADIAKIISKYTHDLECSTSEIIVKEELQKL